MTDKDGFIWLAADKGLFKYNGREYQLLDNPLKRGRSLFGLKTDLKGRVWCNNLAGQFFYVENNKLHLFKDFEDINTLVDYYFLENYLVTINNKYISFTNLTTKKNERVLKNTDGIPTEELNDNFKDFHFSSNYNLFKITDINKEKVFVSSLGSKDEYVRGRKIGFKLHEKKYILAQSEKELSLKISELNTSKNTQINVPEYLNGILIHKVTIIKNTLFLLSNKGVFSTSIKDNRLIINDRYFKDNYVTEVVLDKNENYWFSTLRNGIYIISNKEIKVYNQLFDKITTLRKKNDKTLFLASSNGTVEEYHISTKAIKKLNFISNTAVKTFYYIPKNNSLLIGTSNYAVNYNLNNNSFKSINESAAWKSVDFINNDNYLVSTPNSLSQINITSKQYKHLIHKRTYAALYAKKENSYYATMIDGFLKYDIDKEKGTYLKYKNKRVYGSKLAELEDGTIWVATHNKGVFAFKNNTFVDSLVVKNGLTSNVINQIEAYKNELWISTENGLQKYDKTNKTLNTLAKIDGLNSYAIDNIAVLDSLVFITTNKGLLSFNKHKVFKKRKIPELYFTQLIVNDSVKEFPKELKLKELESNFKVEFNSNGFQSKENVGYEYLLERFSNNWNAIENGINFITFNTLPSGKFLLKVRAKNKFQTAYSNVLLLPITVTKPFYKTFWFLLLMLFLVVFLIFIYFKKQNKRLRKEQKIALEKEKITKELVYSQLENLRSQMNPHFIFNALNSIQDFIILNEKKLARQYLVKFSKLIRIYLEQSQNDTVTLAEEIKALRLYLELEKDRFNDDFVFNIVIDDGLNLEQIYIPSLLLQPYVENALKHGLLHKIDNKKLDILFEKDNYSSTLICTILDNGIGREAAAEINKKRVGKHKSFATSANQKRINLLNLANNSNLEILIEDLSENEIATGTKIIIKIPINQ
ncbi:sensor histidine kinase [Polaribacter cellanae]|uniref:Histidine kinase n=1 Tax=Polaribacter cellanae TaxID=2818493 RepID=A0A975CP40_9FLAO|nr:histidine kinase [Polaribacter cellanae]QTE23168.1 histidine kinase [Polaribacter cellanae]